MPLAAPVSGASVIRMKRMLGYVGLGLCVVAIGCGGGGDGDGDGGADVDSGASPDSGPTYDAAPPDALDVCVGGSTSMAKRAAPSISIVDGTPRIEAGQVFAGGPPQACNPVAQTGCDAGEKCAHLVESDSPLLSRTTCVPNGNVPLGGQCAVGAPGPSTGYDDCAAGGHCSGSVCTEICTQAPDSCPQEASCVPFSGLFSDLDGLGLCQAQCDVMAQNCCDGDGCYVSLSSGESSCAPAVPETMGGMPGRQGDACMFLNTCDVGFGCTLIDDPVNTTGNVCAKFCDPAMAGGPTCDDTGTATTCTQINTFYADADNVPDEVGFCIDCAVWTDVPACQ
jgi:hypothetical protein